MDQLDNGNVMTGNVIADTVQPIDRDVGQHIRTGKLSYTILKYFSYGHLPENLQNISASFLTLAEKIAAEGKDPAETFTALRKLLEAKDCTIRSMQSGVYYDI